MLVDWTLENYMWKRFLTIDLAKIFKISNNAKVFKISNRILVN